MNYKPFNLEQAKAQNGEGLITRDGRPARIICWDFKNDFYPLLVAVTITSRDGKKRETPITMTLDGKEYMGGEYRSDLFMAPIKHKGWVNVITNPIIGYCEVIRNKIWDTEKEAKENIPVMAVDNQLTIATIQIEWEE